MKWCWALLLIPGEEEMEKVLEFFFNIIPSFQQVGKLVPRKGVPLSCIRVKDYLVPLLDFGLLQQRLEEFSVEALAVNLHIYLCLVLWYLCRRLGFP